jgi:hypothetical protein
MLEAKEWNPKNSFPNIDGYIAGENMAGMDLVFMAGMDLVC